MALRALITNSLFTLWPILKPSPSEIGLGDRRRKRDFFFFFYKEAGRLPGGKWDIIMDKTAQ